MILQMIDNNKDLLNYLSPKNWAENIDIKTFIMHGANDSMVPFTESTIFKIKEILKMINFFALYFKFNK